MKKLLLIICAFFYLSSGSAQSVTRLLGSSPFQDSLWVMDTTNFNITKRGGPFIPGFTVTGMNGLAKHPLTNEIYIICKVSGVTGRVLGKLNPVTFEITQIGNMGGSFASITFNSNGTLYGVTGQNAGTLTAPETMYIINTSTGNPTFLKTLGNGADGEIISFNSSDNMIYHWSGNSTVVFEKFDTLPGYTPINIPILGAPGGETFGMVHVSGDYFIGSNIASHCKRWYANGTVEAADLSTNPDDLRGMVLLTCPRLISGTPAYCAGNSTTLTMSAGSGYQWYKNGTLLPSETNQTISINSIGYYNCMVTDGCGTDSSATGVTVVQNALPIVNVTGNPNLCPNGTNILTGTGGGTRQWYLNGVAIPSATAVNYGATMPGVYNMIKTNTNTCQDSAAVGITLVAVAAPIVSLGNDTAFCIGDSTILDAQNTGDTYLWNDNSTAQTLTAATTGAYIVTVTNSNNCSAIDTINILINSLPIVNLGIDTAICNGTTVTFDAQNVGATYLWNDNSIAQTLNATAAGTYFVTVTNSNNCSAIDTINISINSLPIVNLGLDTAICNDTIAFLNAQNPGSTYLWNDNSTGQLLLTNTAGNYSVIVTDNNGCVGTDTITISVNNKPVINLGSDTTQCAGTILLDAQIAGVSYLWNDNSTNQTLSTTATGTYNVTVTDGNGCIGMDTILVTINSLPTVTLAVTTDTLCVYNPAITLNAGIPAGGLYSGNGVTGASFNPTTAGLGNQVITYTYTDANGCSAIATDNIIVDACSGIEEQTQYNALTIYPNPSNGNLSIDLTTINEANIVVSLIDITGKIVFNQQIIGGKVSSINAINIDNGIYTLIIQTKNNLYTSKVIITK